MTGLVCIVVSYRHCNIIWIKLFLLHLLQVEAVYSSFPVRDPTKNPSKTFSTPECFTIEEKSEKNEGGDRDSNPGRRKFGVFLTGSALGGIASTFWTYGQLKQQQVCNRGCS